MSLQLNSAEVWKAIEQEIFAVVGMVTARQEARTVGIVYVVHEEKLYVGTSQESWKARHIRANPQISVTIPIAKRIPLMPWLKIPAATITFSGLGRVLPASEVSPSLLALVFRTAAQDPSTVASSCLIEITPQKEFVTYGVGIPLMQMRYPEKARGRAPVALSSAQKGDA